MCGWVCVSAISRHVKPCRWHYWWLSQHKPNSSDTDPGSNALHITEKESTTTALGVMYDGNPKQLGFFLAQVWVYM